MLSVKKLKGESGMNSMIRNLVMGFVVVAITLSASANTTLRLHFNDTTSWDINAANGDYAAGSTGATVAGSPMWDTGFFPGSTPANKAFYVTNATPKVSYVGNDGNVPIYNPTSSVMTVSFWIKMIGNLSSRPVIIRSGGFEDFLMFDFG